MQNFIVIFCDRFLKNSVSGPPSAVSHLSTKPNLKSYIIMFHSI